MRSSGEIFNESACFEFSLKAQWYFPKMFKAFKIPTPARLEKSYEGKWRHSDDVDAPVDAPAQDKLLWDIVFERWQYSMHTVSGVLDCGSQCKE
jgi:hypothetical protein